jgi:hypothetical protein
MDFATDRVETCRANSLSLVRFDCNDYAVPSIHTLWACPAIAYRDFYCLASGISVSFFGIAKLV